MLYVFGLGNYPARYSNTRHNAGVDTLTRLTAFYQVKLRKRCFHLYRQAIIETARGRVCFVFPLTLMNNSGAVVDGLVKEGDEVIVLVDQMDLNPGQLRLKKGGAAAGHNGLKSMMAALPENFTRLYIGVGHPEAGTTVPDWVLSKPSEEDRALIDTAEAEATAQLARYFEGEKFELVQQKINSFKA
jgi:Peptidyl-tRNA hydrolase